MNSVYIKKREKKKKPRRAIPSLRFLLPIFREEIGFVAWFVIGVILCSLELALLYVCMIGLKKICVKLGADPSDPFGTLDVVLDKIWVVPV